MGWTKVPVSSYETGTVFMDLPSFLPSFRLSNPVSVGFSLLHVSTHLSFHPSVPVSIAFSLLWVSIHLSICLSDTVSPNSGPTADLYIWTWWLIFILFYFLHPASFLWVAVAGIRTVFHTAPLYKKHRGVPSSLLPPDPTTHIILWDDLF